MASMNLWEYIKVGLKLMVTGFLAMLCLFPIWLVVGIAANMFDAPMLFILVYVAMLPVMLIIEGAIAFHLWRWR